MDDMTTITPAPAPLSDPPGKVRGESVLCNVSVRGWLVLIIIGTASYMAVRQITIVEPYYSLVMLAAGFYFGQASKPKAQGGGQ